MNAKTFKSIVSNFKSVSSKNSKLSIFRNKIFFCDGKMSVFTDDFKLTYNIDFKTNLCFTVDAKLFSGLIKSLKSSEISLFVDEYQIVVNGLARLDITLLDMCEAFDKDFSQAATVQVPASFSKDLKALANCAAIDELNPVFNGVYFDGSKEGDYIVSSDGHILASRKISDTPSGVSFILPTLAACNFPQVREIQYMAIEGRDYIRACVDGLEIVVRGINGRFPCWRSVLFNGSRTLSVDKNDLKNAVDIAGSIGAARVLLYFLENVIRFFAAEHCAENYSYATSISCKSDLEDKSYISFNTRTLSIIFKVLSDNIFNIIYNGANQALTIDNGNTVILIMPTITDEDKLSQYNQQYEVSHVKDTVQAANVGDTVPNDAVCADSALMVDRVVADPLPVALPGSPAVALPAVNPVVVCEVCDPEILPKNNHGLNPEFINKFDKYRVGDFTNDFMWPSLNKNKRLLEYAECLIYEGEEYYYIERLKIERIIRLSRKDYRVFKNSLLTRYEMLGKIGGSGCDTFSAEDLNKVNKLGYAALRDPEIKRKMEIDGYTSAVLVTDGFNVIAVNTEGYGYARYVGLHYSLADRFMRFIRRKSQKESIRGNRPNIRLIDYSDKCIVVIGDTVQIKDRLKAIGGRYNPALTIDGKKTAGWVFSRRRADQLADLLIDLAN